MREIIQGRALLLLFVLIAPLTAPAEPAVSVSGVVKDPSGALIPGATVTLRIAEQAIVATVITDSEGRFAFTELPAGSYALAVAARGFAERRMPLNLRSGPIEGLTIVLQIRPAQEELTVTASLGEAIAATSAVQPVNVIGSADFRERSEAVLAQVATEEVGIHLQRTSPTIGGIYIRGLTGDKVNVFVDGVRYTNSAQRGGINTFMDLIEPSSFQAMEALRGPGSAQYGSDAIGGSIQLLSREPVFTSGGPPTLHGAVTSYFNSADVAFGSHLSSVYASRKFGVAMTLAGRRINTLRPGGGTDSHSAYTRFLGLKSELFFGDRLPDTAFTQYGGTVRMQWAPAPTSQIIGFYSRGQQDGGKRYDQLLGGDGNFVADLRNLMLDLAYVRYEKLKLGWFDTFSATYSFNTQREERVNQGGNGNILATIDHFRERTTAHGVQLRAGRQWARRQVLFGGIDYYHERIHAPAFTVDPVRQVSSLIRPRIPDNARYDSGGIYLQNEFEAVPDKLRLLVNLRYSLAAYQARAADAPILYGSPLWPDDSLHVSDFTLRAGFSADPVPRLNLFGNVSSGFRAPNMTDLGTYGLTGSGYEVAAPDVAGLGATVGSSAGPDAVSTGKPVEQVTPENSWSYEGGIRWRSDRFQTELAVFLNDLSDIIAKEALILPPGAVGTNLGGQIVSEQNENGVVYVPASSAPVLVRTNFDKVRIYGLEHTLDWRLRSDVSLATVFTYLYARNAHTGAPPEIEGGTPAPDGYLKLRYSPMNERFWLEAWFHAAARQDRISSLALQDRRTGAARSRSTIRRFFQNGAYYRGLVGPGPDGVSGTADDRLTITGETLAQVQDRVLGPGVQSAPLFVAIPGYITFNLRAGLRLGESHDLLVGFENIGDRNYRGVSWGMDASGRSVLVSYRVRF